MRTHKRRSSGRSGGIPLKMGEELDYFLEEQRAKLAQDKAELEKDPPYMEIRSKRFENTDVVDQPRTYAKENIPPNLQYQKEAAQKQIPDTGYGLSLPLGEDYERKKHKLKEELRQDYRRYLNQKHLRTTGEVDPVTFGMSLPIVERLSAKERLRLERNREYNQFLRMKDEEEERIHKAALEGEKTVLNYITPKRIEPEQYPSVPISHRDQALPKKDAYTSMEVYEQLLNKRRSEAERTGRRDHETETENPFTRRPDVDNDMKDHARYISRDWEAERRPLRLNLSNEPDDNNTSRLKYDREGEDKRSMRYNPRPKRILHQHGDVRESHEHRPDQASYIQIERSDHRPHKDRNAQEYPMDYEENFREQSDRRPATSLMRNRAKIENPGQQMERSKSAYIKDESFSTGLMLGGADKDEAQKRRKERYREELIQQMAEQQRNKKREKELELKVAATGAIDPEKQPDRLRQFGAINRQQEISDRNVPYRPGILIDPQKTSRTATENRPLIEEKSPPERPRVAFQTPIPESAVNGNVFPTTFNPANEEYHRGISNILGEIVAPRISAVPPPQPPVLVDNYRTPYDDAYYYYGARNPLDPNLAYYAPGMMATQAPVGINMPATHVTPLYPGHHPPDNKQRPGAGRGASLGTFPEERPRQTREAVLSYQEDLERQIRERNDRRRKEKEEREHYDAKLEADMKNYNPWGKGGGGAPLKDQKGNLITDLKQMHKQNEDAYQNPDVRSFEDRRAVVAVDTSLADPTPNTGKIPGFSFANNSQFARGNVFSEPVTEQQVQQQESYKNFLRQQIEEKRRKEEEERERIRLEEEREERRLAEQRAKIQREFEDEQNRKKMKEEEQRQKNDELVRLADERRKEADRKRKEEEAKHEEELRRLYEQGRAINVNEEQDRPLRQPSPVIPTLQHKVSSRTQRPPTAESVVSVQSHGEPHSRIGSPPVPARRNQLRAYDEKKSVITELTELRKQLRSEQRRLEGRLQDTEQDNDSLPSMSGRKREKTSADVFDLARQRLQATVRRPSLKGQDNVNMQNIRDFNDLKYRDTDTRDGVRIMFPDPPKDDQTLEIQQQALLREQQKNLNKIKRREAIPDDFGPVPAYSLRRPGMLSDPSKDLLKTSLLESESAFIGENGEPYPAFFEALPSARERRRHKNKGLDYDNDFPPVPRIPLNQPDRYSLNSAASFNVDELRTRNDERLRRLSNLQKSTVSIDDDPDGYEHAEDFVKPFPVKPNDRPPSVDTVATDPWMRPGTSETLKRFMAGQMSHDKSTNDNALTFNWQGLSTAHG
ncbi:centrosome and spindle pole-associated protein 1 isoform 2-T2 [Anomaloglossus baeobatrachus]|uniref:centrosome and spindle pole-associated protein 1 isoform X2 n=1 Tax=Anomaloglossus baeobatrachus TaxID=238106 RepID=UPI003F4FF0E8